MVPNYDEVICIHCDQTNAFFTDVSYRQNGTRLIICSDKDSIPGQSWITFKDIYDVLHVMRHYGLLEYSF